MTDTPIAKYPPDTKWWVKALRFSNVLDDAENKLSPVKINVWAANVTAIGTGLTALAAGAGNVFGFLHAHIGDIQDVATIAGGWLAQAHATHHFDKRERNLAEARLQGDQK